MRKSVALGIVVISCLIALLSTNRIALGQAGSTGGTLGKTDKSASGRDVSSPKASQHPSGSRHLNVGCGRIFLSTATVRSFVEQKGVPGFQLRAVEALLM
jgi:hypothetical protein